MAACRRKNGVLEIYQKVHILTEVKNTNSINK